VSSFGAGLALYDERTRQEGTPRRRITLGRRRPTTAARPTKQALGNGIADEASERVGESIVGGAHGDVPGLRALALQQPVGVVQPRAVLEQQPHLCAAWIDGTDVAGVGMAKADAVPALVDAFTEVRLGREHDLPDPL
jgi:hypothetical protein